MTVNETISRIRHWPRPKRISYLRIALALQKSTIRKAELYHALKLELNDQLLEEIAA